MLKMSPNSILKLAAEQAYNVQDLLRILAKFVEMTGQSADVISFQTFRYHGDEPNMGELLELEAECLSDGSIVYNVWICA